MTNMKNKKKDSKKKHTKKNGNISEQEKDNGKKGPRNISKVY